MWLKEFLWIFCVIFYSEASLVERLIKKQRNDTEKYTEEYIEEYMGKSVEENKQSSSCHPDYGFDVFGLLKKYNYTFEKHTVTTEDGYILGLQRIPYGRYGTKSSKFPGRPPVLLQHGLGSSGVDFINKGPNSSIGLLLANEGYDVWLGNNRGTTWSRKHVSLDPDKDKEYWDFSFNECGYYDLPAVVDYILFVTGAKKIFYIGHSQGTTQFFSFVASKPEYNKKIALMSALAPVVHMDHLSSPIFKLLAENLHIVEPLVEGLGITHLSRSDYIADLGKTLCCDGSKYQQLCAGFLFLIAGFNPAQMDMSFIPVIAYNAPGGLSLKMLIHYGQEIHDGYFRRYDYGMKSNMWKYKVEHPPEYNISAITAPIALYYSENDFFAALPDVKKLASELPNVTKNYLVPDRLFSHIDFIWAKDVKTLVNDALIDHMNMYVDENVLPSSSNVNKLSVLLVYVVCFVINFVR